MSDKRQHPRFACDVRAELRAGERVLPVHAMDISRGGICLHSDEPAAVGATVGIALTLILRSGRHSEQLRLPARVIWCTPLRDGHQIGCMFGDLKPPDGQYLDMFLRFLLGEVPTNTDDIESAEPDEDPDSEPFT